MQEAIERILEGKFNNNVRLLEFSSPVIELTVKPEEIYEGSFTIYGPEDVVTEGRISSTGSRMQPLTEVFFGGEEEIGFRFNSAGMDEGENLKGEFRIISNHGEYLIPYEVQIADSVMESSLGNIRNLFHFANLARSNWEEAVNLFYSEGFKQVFHGVDKQYYSAYRGLLGGKRSEQRVEEFLLEIKKKQRVEFIPEMTEIRLENPKDMEENKIVIGRNGWGYSELHVEKEGNFLILEKEVIRDEDFLGNCYRLPFYVSRDRLHAGKNYGSVRFYNPYVSFEVKIMVHCKPLMVKSVGIRRQKKHILAELMQYYEAFRTKKISSSLWLKETKERVEKLMDIDDKDVGFKLFWVQLLITEERYNEAQWMLSQVDAMLEGEFEPALYCYYLYLTTLVDREEEYIDEVAARVERIFAQNDNNWRIAWLLLYLSEEYMKSPSKKWLILEEQFRLGCSSPVLYIEGWNLLASNPTLLMQLEGFELQVLSYAAKKELLTAEVIEQVVYLAQKQRMFDERLFFILKNCYACTPTDQVLAAICTLLIKGNITEKYAFSWYEKGINRELRITRLYEYYMMSVPLNEEQKIPKMVLMYFAFDSNLDSTNNAFLYYYVYKNRGEYPELYESYKDQIERFMVFQILKEKNNKWLAHLYKNLITPVMITQETAPGLITVLFTHKLILRRRDIYKVILIYEKERQEVTFPVTGTEMYLPIYGSDCTLVLEDGRGNRYCREEEYTLERLLIPDKLSHMAAPYVEGEIHFDMWLCENGKDLAGITEGNEAAMKRVASSELILEDVQKEIRSRLLHYYYDNDKMRELDGYLAELMPEQIAGHDFALVVRFMVTRGMYEKAYEWIQLRGGEGIEAKLIVRLCSRLLSQDGMMEDDAMTSLAYMAFWAGKYDENMLTYLCRFFKGTVKEMRDIWKAAEAFGVDTYELSERILVQMLYTGAYVGEKNLIFRKYVSGGAKSEVELAFLAQSSYDYFVKDKLTDEFIMEDMNRVVERETEIPLVCKLAYTRYYAENKRQVNEKISRYLILFLRDLLAEEIYFPYYKEYAENILFMRQFADKTMIEYKVKEGCKAMIHYVIEKDEPSSGEYIREEMQDMFGGVCVKQFVLFFGERLQYYITETEPETENEQLTESGTLSRNDTDRDQKESRYSLINDIAVGRTLHDYDTMEKLLQEYYEREYQVRELFGIL